MRTPVASELGMWTRNRAGRTGRLEQHGRARLGLLISGISQRARERQNNEKLCRAFEGPETEIAS